MVAAAKKIAPLIVLLCVITAALSAVVKTAITCSNAEAPIIPDYAKGNAEDPLVGSSLQCFGLATSSCTLDGWSDVSVTCQARQACSDPPIIAHSIMTTNSSIYAVGATVQYRCIENYRLQGDDQAICGADGNWEFNSGTSCTQERIYGNVYIRYGETPFSGYIAVWYTSNSYAFLCSDGFTKNAAQVVCRQMGMQGGIAHGPWSRKDFRGRKLSNLRCDGTEAQLTDCYHTGFTYPSPSSPSSPSSSPSSSTCGVAYVVCEPPVVTGENTAN